MKSVDLEKLNRHNFKAMMNALSMPGKIENIIPLYKSSLLALANVLLYNEVSFFYAGEADMSLVEAINNPKVETNDNADYIFSDVLNPILIKESKKGDYISPDFSATLIFTCKDFNQTKVSMSGPGIDGKKDVYLPCDKEFIKAIKDKNSDYPLGVEIYLVSEENKVMAISRTTKIEVA